MSIDEKIECFLGHFRKEFEGGVSTTNLGARFGSYGSFLPTCESPQQSQCNALSSSVNVPHSKDEKIERFLGHFRKEFEGGVSATNLGARFGSYGSFLPTCESPQQSKCNAPPSSDNVPASKGGKRLVVKIKLSRKTSILPDHDQSPKITPSKIIEEMCSFPAPNGTLISPLDDSLIELSRKEKSLQQTKKKLISHKPTSLHKTEGIDFKSVASKDVKGGEGMPMGVNQVSDQIGGTKKRKLLKDGQDDQKSHNNSEISFQRFKKKKKCNLTNDIAGTGMEQISRDKKQIMQNNKIIHRQTPGKVLMAGESISSSLITPNIEQSQSHKKHKKVCDLDNKFCTQKVKSWDRIMSKPEPKTKPKPKPKPEVDSYHVAPCPNGVSVRRVGKIDQNIHQNHDTRSASNIDTIRSSNQAACNTLEVAKKLRDNADNLKSAGFSFESNELYFQSALKYLHGAFLQESFSKTNGKHDDMTHMKYYAITAELCQICGIEYESRGEMGAAALTFKCMEVAYLRIAYHKESNVNGDYLKMQSMFNTIMQGESPSSSSVPCIWNARNYASFARVLDYVFYMNSAMEASRKCQNAFMAVNSSRAKNVDYVASVKNVIDFSFQDVEQFIRLATQTIARS